MRAYIPVNASVLHAFLMGENQSFTRLFIPSEGLANEYGVIDGEEVEYAALEIARASAEREVQELILALELSDKLIADAFEPSAGIVEGLFTFQWSAVAAIYRISSPEEELEWYDASEASLCLSKVTR
jgi:hypothetical protein